MNSLTKISSSNIMVPTIKSDMNDSYNINKNVINQFLNQYKIYIDSKWVDFDKLANDIFAKVPDIITKEQFYNLISDHCATLTSTHPEYNKLASRICMNKLHETTPSDMLEVAELLYNNEILVNINDIDIIETLQNYNVEYDGNIDDGETTVLVKKPLVSKDFVSTIKKYNEVINIKPWHFIYNNVTL